MVIGSRRRRYAVKQRMYRGGRPGRLARAMNRMSAIQFSAALLSPKRAVTLEVPGRISGRTIALPLVVTDHGGERYLVSMLGSDANWVRNVRAAHGRAVLRRGHRQAVLLVEVPPAERAPILRRYLALAPGARPHIPVDRRAPVTEFEPIAAKFPVFRICPDPAADTLPATTGQQRLSTGTTMRKARDSGTVAQLRDGDLDDRTAQRAKQSFRYFNKFMVLMWRLGLGRWVNAWPNGSGRILVLGHTGRRTGLTRWTPLNYAGNGGLLYCIAGFGAGSDWYRNVLANPLVEVWLPGQRWAGEIEDISDDPRRVALVRSVVVASGFAARAAGLDPVHLDDSALAAATSSYRLLRIRRAGNALPLPGHPRPGDRIWWWAAVLAVIAFAAGAGRAARR